MPSGDSAFGAQFLAVVAFVFNQPWLLAFTPVVMLGRIYFHCHWILDTIAGAGMGTTLAYASFSLFPFTANLFA